MIRLHRSFASCFILGAALAACGGGSTAAPPVQAPAATPGDATCPVEVAGTSVAVDDVPTGASLVFVTTGDVEELRRRARAMVAMHHERHAKMAQEGHEGGGPMMVMARAQVTTEDIDGGARIVIEAGPDDVAAVRDMVREHAAKLATGSCEMPDHAAGPHHDGDHGHGDHHGHDGHDQPDPAQVKAALLAAETSAFEAARPVFDRYCASCHTKGGKGATAAKLDHFDMTAYPFGGHHAGTMGATIREVLGIDGGKAKMPKGRAGVVKGDELALIAAWTAAFDASHAGGAHEGLPGHEQHGGHGDHH